MSSLVPKYFIKTNTLFQLYWYWPQTNYLLSHGEGFVENKDIFIVCSDKMSKTISSETFKSEKLRHPGVNYCQIFCLFNLFSKTLRQEQLICRFVMLNYKWIHTYNRHTHFHITIHQICMNCSPQRWTREEEGEKEKGTDWHTYNANRCYYH